MEVHPIRFSARALEGLAEFSHIEVLFVFHQVEPASGARSHSLELELRGLAASLTAAAALIRCERQKDSHKRLAITRDGGAIMRRAEGTGISRRTCSPPRPGQNRGGSSAVFQSRYRIVRRRTSWGGNAGTRSLSLGRTPCAPLHRTAFPQRCQHAPKLPRASHQDPAPSTCCVSTRRHEDLPSVDGVER